MSGALEVVALRLHDVDIDDSNILRVFGLTRRHGPKKLAFTMFTRLLAARIDYKHIPAIAAPYLAQLVAFRQERIAHFTNALKSTADGARFRAFNDWNAVCPRNGSKCTVDGRAFLAWQAFQLAVLAAYAGEPSLQAVIQLPEVKKTLRKLYAARCSCREPLFDWTTFKDDLKSCEAPLPQRKSP